MIHATLLTLTLALASLSSLSSAAYVTVYGVQAPPVSLPTPDPSDTISYIKPSIDWAGTETASALGPGESGRTKYEVKYIESRFVVHRSGVEPYTVVSEPMTATYTHEQGGDILIQKGDPAFSTFKARFGVGFIEDVGVNVECTLDKEKQIGVCTGEHLFPIVTEIPNGSETIYATATETVGTTYTGSMFPIATLSVGGAGSTSSMRSTALLIATVLLGAFVTF